MLYQITNGNTTAQIDTKGAQLRRLSHFKIEYLWPGSADTWTESAPVLFPVVGRCKNNQLEIDGVFYPMPQHGFAKDMEFTPVFSEKEPAKIQFILKSNKTTKQYYPYDFTFTVCFSLEEGALFTEYQVENTGAVPLWFGLGGHPGFRVPLCPEDRFEDWELVFEKEEPLFSIPVNPQGVIAAPASDQEKNLIPAHNRQVALKRSLFHPDAMIFEHLASQKIIVRHSQKKQGVEVTFSDFPYLALWTLEQEEAAYVCIEPWQGMAHVEGESGLLKEKKGVLSLSPGSCHKAGFLTKILV